MRFDAADDTSTAALRQAVETQHGALEAVFACVGAPSTKIPVSQHPHEGRVAHGVSVSLLAPSLIDSPLAQQVMAVKGVTAPERYYRELTWGRPLRLNEVAAACIEPATALRAFATGQTYPLGATL